MHLFIVGGAALEAEFRQKFGPAHTYDFCADDADDLLARLAAADTAFDLRPYPELHYEQPRQPLFYDTSHRSLIQLFHGESAPFGPVFGFCGLPTLINRPLLEVSLHDEADAEKLQEICGALGTDYRVVEDRVGLVTPRVVCMIINEACYTVQEGTATMQDVDLGMKLGTNYPRGPFAWANAIGVERVHTVLEALWDDTHDERYKICPLLKRQALKGQPFAV